MAFLRGAFRLKQDVAISRAVLQIFDHFKSLKLTSGHSLCKLKLNFEQKNIFSFPPSNLKNPTLVYPELELWASFWESYDAVLFIKMPLNQSFIGYISRLWHKNNLEIHDFCEHYSLKKYIWLKRLSNFMHISSAAICATRVDILLI